MPTGACFFLTAFLSLCATSCRTGLTTSDSPEQILNVLKSGSPEEKTRIKQELHMPSAFIKNCENGDASLRDVELRSAVLENGMENAIITAKCGYNFLLIAQVRDGNGKWKYEDSMLLNAVYDNLVVTLQPIVAPPVEDVVVHAHVSLQGTGIYQANFLILKLVDGRFRVVLDAIEESHVSLNRASQPPIEQKSTFNITPKTGDEAATVDEIQTVTVGNKSTISEREFNWDDNLHVFQVSLWETSKAR